MTVVAEYMLDEPLMLGLNFAVSTIHLQDGKFVISSNIKATGDLKVEVTPNLCGCPPERNLYALFSRKPPQTICQ